MSEFYLAISFYLRECLRDEDQTVQSTNDSLTISSDFYKRFRDNLDFADEELNYDQIEYKYGDILTNYSIEEPGRMEYNNSKKMYKSLFETIENIFPVLKTNRKKDIIISNIINLILRPLYQKYEADPNLQVNGY